MFCYSLGEIAEVAFVTYVAIVALTENIIDRVRNRGFTLKETSVLTVENNRFNVLEDMAFVLPEGEITDQLINLTFRGNSMGTEVGKDIFDFSRKQIGTNINNNSFDSQCRCEEQTKTWFKEWVNGSELAVEVFYNTSLCKIDKRLSNCYSVSIGSFPMDNFTLLACNTDGQYHCTEALSSDDTEPADAHSYDKSDSVDRERTVLGLILACVTGGVVFMLVFSGLTWLRRRGYCTKARLLLLPSADSVFGIISRVVVGSGTEAAPTGAPSAHDYAELQAQRAGDDSAEEDVSVEDKATQTLPEELTQELLQTLREKLDDPENYGEARDMIEHLYDLIKVEESCNRNSDLTSLQLDGTSPSPGENLYDIIQSKVKRKRVSTSTVSVGTRVPSLDRLSLSRVMPTATVVCDYGEPVDRACHVYQELPTVMINRPLPNKPDNGCDMYL